MMKNILTTLFAGIFVLFLIAEPSQVGWAAYQNSNPDPNADLVCEKIVNYVENHLNGTKEDIAYIKGITKPKPGAGFSQVYVFGISPAYRVWLKNVKGMLWFKVWDWSFEEYLSSFYYDCRCGC